jgi:hypothetical protein
MYSPNTELARTRQSEIARTVKGRGPRLIAIARPSRRRDGIMHPWRHGSPAHGS